MHRNHISTEQFACIDDLDLDLDYSPYPTGHIGPHSDAIRVCQELPPLLPRR